MLCKGIIVIMVNVAKRRDTRTGPEEVDEEENNNRMYKLNEMFKYAEIKYVYHLMERIAAGAQVLMEMVQEFII